MNTGFYQDLDINFQEACLMSEKDFTHLELLEFLKNGNIPQKQIAALKLDFVNSEDEAKVLVDNLTGCDGKIREAVALKINSLLHYDENLKNYFNYPEIFANATIDINANICRLVIDSVIVLKTDNDFSKKYLLKIKDFISETFKELDSFIFRDKKYVINKQLFKLYWCLEAIKFFVDDFDNNELLNILVRANKEKEYTIREKVAQIIVHSNWNGFEELKNVLKNDENYYVREVFRSKF